MPLVDFFCETCSKPWLVGWWDQVGDAGWRAGRRPSASPRQVGLCVQLCTCVAWPQSCGTVSVCGPGLGGDGGGGAGGVWPPGEGGSLPGCDSVKTRLCLVRHGECPVWVMAWPCLRSYGCDRDVCRAMFVSPNRLVCRGHVTLNVSH